MQKSLIIFMIIFSTACIFAQKVTVGVSFSALGASVDIFEAKSTKINGVLIKKKSGEFSTRKLSIETKSLKTGIDLRDEHLHKHLKADKFPFITLKKVKVLSSGKAKANLLVAGTEKEVSINFSDKAGKVYANFEIKNSSFGLEKASYEDIGVNDSIKITAEIPYITK